MNSSQASDPIQLLAEVQAVGQRLVAARPGELAVGNVVRRVLGLIREEAEQSREERSVGARTSIDPNDLSRQRLHRRTSSRSASKPSETSLPKFAQHALTSENQNSVGSSMLNLLNRTSSVDPRSSHLQGSRPMLDEDAQRTDANDLKSEVVEGIQELLDELRQVEDHIAGYAVEQIHPQEVILTNATSKSVTKFLLKAAAKRRFSVVIAENYPNSHDAVYDALTGKHRSDLRTPGIVTKSLMAAGLTVILVPDSAIFGLMAGISKVLLAADIVLADGSFLCSSGARTIAKAAKLNRKPVVVLAGVYKITPQYPFQPRTLLNHGNIGVVLSENDWGAVDVQNPLNDHVPAELVDLYISNIGGHSPSSLNRVISDHYRTEDTYLRGIERWSSQQR